MYTYRVKSEIFDLIYNFSHIVTTPLYESFESFDNILVISVLISKIVEEISILILVVYGYPI